MFLELYKLLMSIIGWNYQVDIIYENVGDVRNIY
nr:hypothetical protein CJLB15_00004 [Campylobacter phage CJLB-15]